MRSIHHSADLNHWSNFCHQSTFIRKFFSLHKKGQQKDIDKAKEYWREHLSLKEGKNEKV